MAPILIDNRGLIKLGLISLLTVLAAFSAGYFTGYQKASVFYTTTSEIKNLALPERDFVDASNVESHSPEIAIEGEEIDVDQPVITHVDDVQEKTKVDSVAVTKMTEVVTKSPKKSVEIESSPEASIEVVQQVTSKSVQTFNSSIGENTSESKKIDVSSLTNDELNVIKYSVQVGVYGNLINAESMVKKLQTRQFDAYVSDYKNKKNETRYNVRFGYFADKKAAIKGLKRYKQAEKGDGYLVNFSVESIVNLAEKNTINDNVKPESPIDVIDKSKPSDIDASEITHNAVIQEKYLTKLQSETIIKN